MLSKIGNSPELLQNLLLETVYLGHRIYLSSAPLSTTDHLPPSSLIIDFSDATSIPP